MAYKIWSKSSTTPLPTLITHTFSDDGAGLWTACQRIGCPNFHLICLYDIDLDAALTPWPAEGVRKGQPPFAGTADTHLKHLLQELLPEVESQLSSPTSYYAMVGYSLAGLFALWASTQTAVFQRIACASASFWYPNFVEYLEKNRWSIPPQCVYLSLGDKESQTRHPLMRQIDERTERIFQLLQQCGIPTIKASNPGNHFTEPHVRLAKGILWILSQD